MRLLENKPIGQFFSEDIISGFRVIINNNLARSTYNRYLNNARSIFNYAQLQGYISRNPVKSIKYMPSDSARERFLTAEEKERLIDAVAKSKSSYLYNMVMVAIYTGMRLGEIRKLRKEDIRDGFIHVPQKNKKAKKSKQIPIHDELQKIFDSIKGEFDFDHNPYKTYQLCVSAAGIEDFRFHDLRHCFATDIVNGGGSIYTVAKLLGHKSAKTSEIYSHLADNTLKRAVRSVNRRPTKYQALTEAQITEAEDAGEKHCPDCAERVKLAAKVCRFCGFRFL
jgi:integrase